MGGYWAFSAVFAEQFNEECFPCGSAGKESVCNAGDLGLIPGLGRSSGKRERLPTPVF